MPRAWRVAESGPFEAAGNALAFTGGAAVRARLVFGPPHGKAFLHLYARDGTPLTHPGVDAAGVPFGEFPRLRGFGIGWSRVVSDLGVDDFWHAGGPAEMAPTTWRIQRAGTQGLVATVGLAWRSAHAAVTAPLLFEMRTIGVGETAGDTLQIDTTHELKAEREVLLDGDAHHGGAQFRAAAGIDPAPGAVEFAWAPDAPRGEGIVAGSLRRWLAMRFRLAGAAYQCVLLNHPENPLEEIAWRRYGRCGFFFRRRLLAGEVLRLRYRLMIGLVRGGKTERAVRAAHDREFARFVGPTRREPASP